VRTTVDLDDDVQAAVDRLRRSKKLGLSQAVNELVRAGLGRKAARAPFRQRTQALGITVDVSSVADAVEVLDGPHTR
jgi:Arc/MetJ family transcription regulator